MLNLKEMQSNTGRFCSESRKGVISSWFFCMFLFAFSLIVTAYENDVRMVRTVINLKTAQEYLNAETEVIADIRCRLEKDELTDGRYECAGYAYGITVSDDLISCEIDEPYETLIIELKEERIIDYTSYRNDVVIEE